MPRNIEPKNLETPTARANRKKIKLGREPHWYALFTGKAHLGYQRRENSKEGRWLLRRNLGGDKYTVTGLGRADDAAPADGDLVFSFDQAKVKATAMVAQGKNKVPKGSLTVTMAFDLYIDFLDQQGKSTKFTRQRADAVILPDLGKLLVAELDADRLRQWLRKLAASPALLRSKKGAKKRNMKPKPDDEEAIRQRRSSANRVLSMVKAALNHAYDEELVDSADAWGRRLKPFKGVDEARLRYLQIEEAKNLITAAAGSNEFPGFATLVQAALQSGCRYGELCRLRVIDFNADAGTLAIRKTKTHKARHVILTPEGRAFFVEVTVGRRGEEFLLRNEGRRARRLAKELERFKAGKVPAKVMVESDKGEWRASEQNRPMRDVCVKAEIEPLGIHALRHTWASHAVMNGMPLLIVAKNLGHKDTRMVERHYGHLAPGYVREAIHAGAPRFGLIENAVMAAH